MTIRYFLLAAIFSVLGFAAQAETIRTATFAGGCFWCVESDFEGVPGVKGAISGYTGGTTKNPTYKQVSNGGTGHYEAVQITYDADQVSFERLLHLFYRSVDPTDGGGQFCDRGQSYATAVFFNNDAEKKLAKRAQATARAALGKRIATKIKPASEFYPAEAIHQDYYKGTTRVLTRFGWIKKSDAYKRYRKGCGRDQRVRELWGKEAPFAG